MYAERDLTAAARIREAAMGLFAQRGAAGVTIREIAAAAGVSPSLVIHHYGSKDELRQAVDGRAMSLFKIVVDELAAPSNGDETADSLTAAFFERLKQEPTLLAYVRRLLVDGGPAADSLFRALFDATLSGLATLEAEGLLRPSQDDRVRAAFLLCNDLAALLLREQIVQVLGLDPLAPAGMRVWTAALLEVYTRGVFGSGTPPTPPADHARDAS